MAGAEDSRVHTVHRLFSRQPQMEVVTRSVRLEQPRDPCSIRTWDIRDVASAAPGSLDRLWSAARAARRARDACRYELLNVYVLDLA